MNQEKMLELQKILGGNVDAYKKYHHHLFSGDDNLGFAIVSWMHEYFVALGRPKDCNTLEDACLFFTMTALLHARDVLGIQSDELPSEEDWTLINGMASQFEKALDDWLSDGYSNDQSLFASFVTMWLAFYDFYKKVPQGAVDSVAEKVRSFLTAYDVAAGEKPGNKRGERWDLLRNFYEAKRQHEAIYMETPLVSGLVFSPGQCEFGVMGGMTKGEWLQGMMMSMQGDG